MAVSVLSVVGSQAQKHHTMVLQPILAVSRFGNLFRGLCSGSACVQINLCLLPLSPGAVSYSQVLKLSMNWCTEQIRLGLNKVLGLTCLKEWFPWVHLPWVMKYCHNENPALQIHQNHFFSGIKSKYMLKSISALLYNFWRVEDAEMSQLKLKNYCSSNVKHLP